MLPLGQWRPLGAMTGGGLTASYAHEVRLQAVTIVSRSAQMTRRRDAAATPSRPSGGNAVGCTHGSVLPPLRGSDVNIVFTVGYEHAFGVHFTHGWVPASLRDSCGLHPRLGAFPRHAAVIAPSGRHFLWHLPRAALLTVLNRGYEWSCPTYGRMTLPPMAI